MNEEAPIYKKPDQVTDFDILREAWAIIANAYGGEWGEASDVWHSAAERFRDRYIKILEKEKTGGGCTFAGYGRGDCENSVGLPGRSIPGQHDGNDDTVDVYGKPNGWCWSCWKSERIKDLAVEVLGLKGQLNISEL